MTNNIIEEKVKAIAEFVKYGDDMNTTVERSKLLIMVRTALLEADQAGYERGFVEGQKHAFGVDRKRVEQEGYARAMGEMREMREMHDYGECVNGKCNGECSPTDNNKEV